MSELCTVLDVGKTHVKLHVIDKRLNSRFCRSRSNRVIEGGLYPHYDIDALWHWISATLAEAAAAFDIDVIAVTTHGATAALVDSEAGESGLVLPVMDYEFEGVAADSNYEAIRPPFSETCSPSLPAGLNLGRQLFWQQRYCDRAFSDAQYILPYPQYWAWRLTRVAVSEVTSWGCHTDLWQPAAGDYSTLVDKLGIRAKLPPLVHAGELVGTLSAEVAAKTGLSSKCRVIAGLHDSNASYLRYLSREKDGGFAVISTGTWVITFSSCTPTAALDAGRDMLANVDINGRAVACARFMGGREYEAICRHTGCKPEDRFTDADLQQVLDDGVFALPDFSDGSGPFGGRTAQIQGHADSGAALASLYCALMVDYELEMLGSEGDLVVEGAWLRNPLLCGLLAQLRPGQPVLLSADETGTVSGAAQLALGLATAMPTLLPAQATGLQGLAQYRQQWRQLVKQAA